MRFVFNLMTMIVVALAIGFSLSYYALTDGRFFGALQSGPWVAWPDAGSPNPNPYTRAHLTRVGAVQLGQSEGLQFIATTDSEGEPLTRDCTYRIDGRTPVATFWTLAAVDEDGVAIVPEGRDLVMRSNAIARDADGSIVVNVGTTLAPLNWYELTGEGAFSLYLTLYDTVISSSIDSSPDALPSILRERCA